MARPSGTRTGGGSAARIARRGPQTLGARAVAPHRSACCQTPGARAVALHRSAHSQTLEARVAAFVEGTAVPPAARGSARRQPRDKLSLPHPGIFTGVYRPPAAAPLADPGLDVRKSARPLNQRLRSRCSYAPDR
jgi:hypothetical protein